jgi:diguanylate cyclase (GGDEF)-like protein
MSPECSERVTISIGVAEALPEESSASLLARADGALYKAKRNGRNQVATATDSQSPRLSVARSE